MFKKILIVALTLGLMAAFTVQNATALDPKWREKQAALFEQIGLKPGDTIEKGDWKKIESLVPDKIVEWVKTGDIIQMKIAEMKYDILVDDAFIKNSAKNAGNFKLDSTKNLVKVANGKPPEWIHGTPFPNVDIANDPDGATKYLYNRLCSLLRWNSSTQVYTVWWVGEDGLERTLGNRTIRYCYWFRPPQERTKNLKGYRFVDLYGALFPYDVAGMAQMTYRKSDGSEDALFCYVPAIRRVKRMSGANRSDAYMGSDGCIDDTAAFAGLISSMKWRFIEERPGLLCFLDGTQDSISKMQKLPDGTFRTPSSQNRVRQGWEKEGWKGAKWAITNLVWVPRTFYVIEALPLDPFYNYGKTVYWIDKETYWGTYKQIWDRAGEYWKTNLYLPRCFEWGNERGVTAGSSCYLIIDKRTNHCTIVVATGESSGLTNYLEFNNPNVNPGRFTMKALRTWSK